MKGAPEVATADRPSAAAAPRPVLGAVELATLGTILLIVGITTWSLALAQLGAHSGLGSIGLGSITAALASWLLIRATGRPEVRLPRGELALGLMTLLGATIMFFPGAPYAYGDKDPGVYMSHAFAIARTGDVVIPDRVLEEVEDPGLFGPGSRYPGLWIEADAPTSITPQFYHLYPATVATAIDLVGPSGAWHLNPLFAVISTLAVALAVRRVLGTPAGFLAAALLVTSMMQVWQAKYTSTEIISQTLLTGAILGLVLAVETRWAAPAAVAGLAVGTGFLARPDGVLYLLMAVGGCAALVAARRWDRRAGWFAAGLAASVPYAIWNAFVVRTEYTLVNTVPRLSLLTAAVVAVLLAGFAVRALHPRPFPRLSRAWERGVGLVVSVLAGIGLLVAWYREDLFGIDYTTFAGRPIRSFDERNLLWLSYFFTIEGLTVMWFGLAVVLVRRWRLSALLLVVPGVALLPLYLAEAKISPRLMWWVRRFIPGIVPALIVLMTIGLVYLLFHRRWPLRIVGAVLGVALLVDWSQQSWPLRPHRELGGSYSLGAAIASEADGPDDGVLLFAWPTLGIWDPNRNLPGPIMLIHDRTTALLPSEPTMADVERYRDAFPGEEILLVTQGDEPIPEGLNPSRFERVAEHGATFPVWEESVTERPDEVVPVVNEVTVWRYLG